MQKRRTLPARAALAAVAVLLAATAAWARPAPPGNLTARDHPWDNGESIDLSWNLSPDDPDDPDDPGGVQTYKVLRSLTPDEVAQEDAVTLRGAVRAAKEKVTQALLQESGLAPGDPIPDPLKPRIRKARQLAAEAAEAAAEAAASQEIVSQFGPRYKFLTFVMAGTNEFTVEGVERDEEYRFQVLAVGPDGSVSAPAVTAAAVEPKRQIFDGARFPLFIITLIICGSVVAFIEMARRGMSLKLRKIAGLEAVTEAVGRATEMGRPVLFIPGIQDMNEIQTIAGLTVLSRVAKTAAEYDAKIEVPTTRALVMTAARETVQAAFLEVGRPDAYREDRINYITDEQFGYVAHVSGYMVRKKPAACFYMGAFFAESLILAETGNAIGAIQIAGTAMPAQLPFFVAACDYTLIGEEFFAASAYLSGKPEMLGSLKGQDVGKVVVAVIVVIGVALATIGVLFHNQGLSDWVEQFLKYTILT